jgi:endonuclease/exonuclease/phosphatase family metal-dependent hydrolase
VIGMPVESLKLMSFNVWQAGANVVDGERKVRAAIERAGADIVAMQESNGLAARLAVQLGWHATQPSTSVAVLSRYPITEIVGVALNDAGIGARLSLDDDPSQEIILWSVHLTPFPYAPYDACLSEMSVQEIMDRQVRTQLPEIEDILTQMQPYIANATDVPVFAIGDFNTASHLDWTAATSDLHCGYVLRFPVTASMVDAGLVDAYRELHPDPRTDPGNTWSPIYENFVYEDGKVEPLDRIDMVHYAGTGLRSESASVFVLGTRDDYPNHQNNEWPSDHAAIVVNMRWRRAAGDAGGQ